MSSQREDFLRDHWRKGVEGRRALGLELVREHLESGEIESAFERIKRVLVYSRMPKRDQDNLRKMFSELRKITENWGNIDETMRFRFLNGFVPYSSLAKSITGGQN